MKREQLLRSVLTKAVILLIITYIVARAGTFIVVNTIFLNLYSGKITVAYLLHDNSTNMGYHLAADIISLLAAALTTALILKDHFNKFYSSGNNASLAIPEQPREREKLEKVINKLENMYNGAVEYNRQQTEFFSNITHELKTPLTVILGAVQLINRKNTDLYDDKKFLSKHFSIIKQNCYRMVRLINNILDITKIDSGYIKVNMVDCNIVYLIEEITQSIVPYAEQKGLSLEFDTEEEEIVTAVDVDKIERIMLNLLSNAIKFTPANGKVFVTVCTGNNSVVVSVKDTGMGIPQYMQDLIFERYKQVNSSLTREYEGTGIGLSLVKYFVELHGGSIQINSQEGNGSEFIVEIPVKLCGTCAESSYNINSRQNKIIEAINIEFSDIYNTAS